MNAAIRLWFIGLYTLGIVVTLVRFVRHPTDSAVLALWLGAALGTLNVILLGLWVVPLLGVLAEARAEDQLLRAKFGPQYATYAARTGSLVPRWLGRR